jgi:hypothetical protein
MVHDDLNIDETELATESLKIPQIHNRYIVILSDEKIILSRFKTDLKRLIRQKWLYYTGKISKEQLDDLGWEPFNLTILKTDLDKFIESDDDIITLVNSICVQEQKVSYLEEVIKNINGRQWMIKCAIEWMKFTNGV